jgi:hypothetical protein
VSEPGQVQFRIDLAVDDAPIRWADDDLRSANAQAEMVLPGPDRRRVDAQQVPALPMRGGPGKPIDPRLPIRPQRALPFPHVGGAAAVWCPA